MDSSITAIWSAVAASCSATAALAVLQIHRRNSIDAMRPELVITGWKRLENHSHAPYAVGFGFDGIRNVGRGPAVDIQITFSDTEYYQWVPVGTGIYPFLPSSEEIQVNVERAVNWSRVKRRRNGDLYDSITIAMRYQDVRGREYTAETEFDLHHFAEDCLSANSLGIDFHSRTVRTRSAGAMRMARVPQRMAQTVRRWRSNIRARLPKHAQLEAGEHQRRETTGV